MTDLVSWAATVAFTASYFFPERPMRVLQLLGAALWLGYGVLLGEAPIIVANALVLGAALWTLRREPRQRTVPALD